MTESNIKTYSNRAVDVLIAIATATVYQRSNKITSRYYGKRK